MSIDSNLNGVTQLGSWTFTLGAALPAGGNTIGGVTQVGTWTVALDGQLLDDDGIPYVNPNVPGADIATGDKQSQQLATLQQIAAGIPVLQQGAWVVAVSSQPVSVLAPNAAQETAGQMQRIADLLERILLQERVNGALLTQLSQPQTDDPEQMVDDLTAALN